MRTTIAHDYCTQYGGAERVALVLLEAFNGAELVTAVHNADRTFAGFGRYTVRTSPLQRVPAFRKDPRSAFPLMAAAWSGLRVDDVDAVVCSSSGWAHGVVAPPGVRKIVYCHNPARWLYQSDDYLMGRSRPVCWVARSMAPALRKWDTRAARTADVYVANSSVVAQRIRRAYGIEAAVVNPPSALDPAGTQEPVAGIEPGYLLSVGRGRGYKNLELVASAVRRHGHLRLVVVGGYDGVEDMPRVTRLTGVSDEELRWLYANAAAVVSLSHEDFGLTPVEGFGFGTPAVLLRAGGFVDSLVEGETGTFVEREDEESLLEALERLPESFRPDAVRRHARRFTPEVFQSAMRGIVADSVAGGRSPQRA